MKTVFIYALCEPGTRTVRYIGKTCDLKRRLREHRKDSAKGKTHLRNWLSSLISRGESVSVVLLRVVPEEEWKEAEKKYIRIARNLGMRLVNATDGGEGMFNPTPEVREAMSKARKGIPKSSETRARMSSGQRGKKHPHRGVIPDPAALARKTGKPHPHVGHPHSAESRARMSQFQRSRVREPHSPKTRAKISAALKSFCKKRALTIQESCGKF